MPQFLKRGLDHPAAALVMISLVAVLTHGLNLAQLGYYHDDWYMLWSAASRGVDSLIPMFSPDRPFVGVIYALVYPMIGQNTLGWHIAVLLLRILGGLIFYWILRLAFPDFRRYAVFAVMLFVVFPGFLAQPNAATKINHLLGFSAALLSIALTLQALRTRSRLWMGICLALSLPALAVYLWIYEYMLGLEVLRLALVYWVLRQEQRKKVAPPAVQALLFYLPYLVVVGIYIYWRAFIYHHELARPTTDLWGILSSYRDNPPVMLARLALQEVKDFLSAGIFAWFVQPYHLLSTARPKNALPALVTAGAAALLASAYAYGTRRHAEEARENGAPVAMMVIGALAVLAAVFPVVFTQRSINLLDAYKAYALHPSPGAILLLLGFVLLIAPKFRLPLLIGLLALSVMTQSLNIQYWADLWAVRRDFWWQLSWRAPQIRDNTMLMTALPEGYNFSQGHEVWAPLNLIYHPEPQDFPLIQSEVLNESTLIDVITGAQGISYADDIPVPENYGNFLLVSQPTASSCAHVIDGAMPAYSGSERPLVREVGGYSDVENILAGAKPAVPPAAIFGPEPARGWCYYYQQAALARQSGDWARIGELYDQVESAQVNAADNSEYFVFVEGLVNLGRMDEARKVVIAKIADNIPLKTSLCGSLSAAPEYPAAFNYQKKAIYHLICESGYKTDE